MEAIRPQDNDLDEQEENLYENHSLLEDYSQPAIPEPLNLDQVQDIQDQEGLADAMEEQKKKEKDARDQKIKEELDQIEKLMLENSKFESEMLNGMDEEEKQEQEEQPKVLSYYEIQQIRQ